MTRLSRQISHHSRSEKGSLNPIVVNTYRMHKHPRSSKQDFTTPRLHNPSHYERKWIGRIPDSYPDILRAPAVSYKPQRDDPRIQSNQYVSFARPYRGKQGLLIIGREYRPVLIDETEPDKPHILPMRLDREAIVDTWIFSVTIYPTEGIIQLEDCVVAGGEQIRSTKPFKERVVSLQRFTESVWFQDKQFQLGWQIQMATFHPLESVRQAIASLSGGCLCLMPNLPTFRLLKIVLQEEKVAPVIVSGPQECICVAVEGKPDVYDLRSVADNTPVGRASIQTLSISQRLQQKVSTGQPMHVLVEWNADFESFVVISVL